MIYANILLKSFMISRITYSTRLAFLDKLWVNNHSLFLHADDIYRSHNNVSLTSQSSEDKAAIRGIARLTNRTIVESGVAIFLSVLIYTDVFQNEKFNASKTHDVINVECLVPERWKEIERMIWHLIKYWKAIVIFFARNNLVISVADEIAV